MIQIKFQLIGSYFSVYHVGCQVSISDVFYFKTFPDASTSWSPSVVMFGDMGNVNAQSMARLQEETQKGMYDMIIHVGDFAYDMDSVLDLKTRNDQLTATLYPL